MGEFEAKGPARQLRGWVLSPEEPGSLKLVLQCEPGSDAGDPEALVQLLLPPEAALYLADELNRQAQRTLDERTRGLPSADASGTRGDNTSRPHRARENCDFGRDDVSQKIRIGAVKSSVDGKRPRSKSLK